MSKSSSPSVFVTGANPPLVVHRKLYEYLVAKNLITTGVYVGHPLLEPTFGKRYTEILLSKDGVNLRFTISRGSPHGPISAVRDVVVTLAVVMGLGRRYDLFVSVGLHLAFLGVFLKKIRIVKDTVFWTIDYFPNRYRNRFLNWISLKLDEICTLESSYAWSISETILDERERRGIRISGKRTSVVPISFLDSEIQVASTASIIPNALLYTGNLNPLYGFDLVVDAMEEVKKLKPEAFVTVASYTPFSKEMFQKIQRLGLAANFHILGQVENDRLEILLKTHRVGLAPYRPEFARSVKNFADPSRVKYYLSRGLPVIVTRAVKISEEVEKHGAGIVIDYDKRQLVDAIMKLLTNDEFCSQCSANSVDLVRNFRSEVVYSQALSRVGIIPRPIGSN